MSDDRERAGVPAWAWTVGALLVLLLGVNLAMSLFEDRLPDVLSPARVQALAFWGGWCAAAGACVAGWWWTGKALERSDRDSTKRLRTCFLLALCVVVLLAFAVFEDALHREHLAATVAGLMALLVIPFTVAARALVDGGHRRRRRRRSSEDAS